MPSYYDAGNRGGTARPSGQRRPSGGRGQGRPSGSSRPRGSRPQQERPLNTRGNRPAQRPYRSNHNYRTISGHDTGYSLHQHNVGFSARGGRGGRRGRDSRSIILIVGAILVVVLLIFGISSCVRGCSARNSSEKGTSSSNPLDERVAAGASTKVTSALTPALDLADTYDKIAANADQYKDVRLIELATREPDAAGFVASYPTAEHTASTYDGEVTKGSFAVLYTWDKRWGNLDYADGTFAVTGSGPTVLSIASMGLTGKSTQTPDAVATTVAEANDATGDAGMSADFVANGLKGIGLKSREYTASGDNIISALKDGSPLVMMVKAKTITPEAHWILITGVNEDGSLNIIDPTCTDASTRTWHPNTVGGFGEDMYALSVRESSSDNGSSDGTSDASDESDSGDASESGDTSESSAESNSAAE